MSRSDCCLPVLCDTCCFRPQETIGKLLSRVRRTEKRLADVHLVCASCSGIPQAEPVRCESLDCPWLFERKKLEKKAETMNAMHALVEELVDLHLEDEASSTSTVVDDILEDTEVTNFPLDSYRKTWTD